MVEKGFRNVSKLEKEEEIRNPKGKEFYPYWQSLYQYV
ncbi:hypothetical protein BLGI_4677 [Brevibacillus laterosporus GI-9]|nr:hypothetical protein BLGI_4677 [Brevibacillus laterosporus GI-9]